MKKLLCFSVAMLGLMNASLALADDGKIHITNATNQDIAVWSTDWKTPISDIPAGKSIKPMSYKMFNISFCGDKEACHIILKPLGVLTVNAHQKKKAPILSGINFATTTGTVSVIDTHGDLHVCTKKSCDADGQRINALTINSL